MKAYALSAVLFFLVSCAHHNRLVSFRRTQLFMGDVLVSMIVHTPLSKVENGQGCNAATFKGKDTKVRVYEAMDQAFLLAREIETQVSEFQPLSDLNRVMKAPQGKWMPVSQHLMTLLSEAAHVSHLTQGAFDISFASKDLSVSYRDVEIDPVQRKVRILKKGVILGVSGLAKGYIVDAMTETLSQRGFNDFTIAAGGDVFAKGRLKVLLENPKQDAGRPHYFRIKNEAVSTSGLYERGPHILNPKTKRPPEHRVVSATVVAPKAILSDALATAAFVMGERAFAKTKIKDQIKGVKVYFLRH